MPEPFKNKFNQDLIEKLATILQENCSRTKQSQSNRQGVFFDAKGFIECASHDLESLELKARSNQICQALHTFLPHDFIISAEIIASSLATPSTDETIFHDFQQMNLAGWVLSPICDYIAHKGLADGAMHFERALDLLHACTQRFTAEFAVRPFLQTEPEKALNIMQTWVTDPNQHVRRLVSEGTRPFLPWGIRLHQFANDPSPVIALLEKLKNDPSEYVRRSVANNLNDIAKVHPNTVANIAKRWLGQSENCSDKTQQKNTFRMVKHACRTLIKNGHPQVLALFGYPPAQLGECHLTIENDQVKQGRELSFTLQVVASKGVNEQQSLLIDYVIHHQKANGTLSPKVFKWKTAILNVEQKIVVKKSHSFKEVTTRKYYSGEHKLEVLINGTVLASKRFELV